VNPNYRGTVEKPVIVLQYEVAGLREPGMRGGHADNQERPLIITKSVTSIKPLALMHTGLINRLANAVARERGIQELKDHSGYVYMIRLPASYLPT